MENDPYFSCKLKSENHNEKDYALRGTHPQQREYEFKDGTDKIVVSSKFDSGNMRKCEQQSDEMYFVWISADCMPFEQKGYYRTWFYFSVRGF